MSVQAETQYDLYFAAYLTALKKNVLIPDHWCDTFNLAETINGGSSQNKNHLIFVSRFFAACSHKMGFDH